MYVCVCVCNKMYWRYSYLIYTCEYTDNKQ